MKYLSLKTMHKHSISLFLVSITFLMISSFAYAEDTNISIMNNYISLYQEQIYSSNNGIPTGEANTVLQTGDGYIYIGGYGGLLRYDGLSFETISGSSGLSSYSIRSLYQSSDGTLWVGSNEQGVFKGMNGVFTRISSSDDGLYLSVRSICEDSSGHIWLGTSDGLAYIEGDTVVPFDMQKFGVKNTIVYTLSSDTDSIIWGVDYNGALFGLDTSKMELKYYFSPGQLWEEGVYAYSAACTANGTIYVGTNDTTILRIDNIKTHPTVIKYDGGKLSGTNSVYIADSGEVWLCGDTGIGAIYEDVFYDCSFFDNAQHLLNIMVDYENNVWAASSKSGVIQLKRSKVCSLTDADVLNGNETYAVATDGQHYYIGYEAGLIILDKTYAQIQNKLTETLDGIHVHAVSYDNGKLYIGTYYSGLYIYDIANDEFENIVVSGSRIRCITPLSNGSIAIGTNVGVDIINGNEVQASYPISLQVLCMKELADGTILVGTDGIGILALKDGKSEKYADASTGLSGGVILRITQDSIDKNNLWVSCGTDLFYGNSNGFHPSPVTDKGSGSILDIYQIDDEIWLFKSSGILCVNRNSLINEDGIAELLKFYSQSDGIPGPLVANSWNLHEGSVFLICTNNGIGVLDVEDQYKNNIAPKSKISNIIFSDGTVWDGSNNITLKKDVSKITFSLSALTFTGDDIKTSVYLEGMDKFPEVRSVSDQHEVSYTNLPAGKYQFHFSVINSDGVSSDETILTVEKEPKFTETPWFYVCLVAGTVLIAGIITYIRIREIRQKQELYKKITDQSISVISGIVDAKDSYTQGHSSRVADISVKIAEKMGLSKNEIERLYYIALLHDIGKIGVPDDILKKPSKLTDEEFHTIQQHVNIGGNILKEFTSLDGASEGALYHHERFDGKGYPSHISGNDIPLFARIIGVADAIDAMSSSRCYRKALSKDVVISELVKGEGKQFDPEIAKLGIEIAEEELTE